MDTLEVLDGGGPSQVEEIAADADVASAKSLAGGDVREGLRVAQGIDQAFLYHTVNCERNARTQLRCQIMLQRQADRGAAPLPPSPAPRTRSGPATLNVEPFRPSTFQCEERQRNGSGGALES